jgi:adenylylsulfate kinase
MAEEMSGNIKWHHGKVTKDDRARLVRQRGVVVWLTGLSGSGKSTIAVDLEHALVENGYYAYVLDGDNIRHGLNGNLTFSPEDRSENIRRIGEVAKLFCDANLITIASFISPYRRDRERVRDIQGEREFIEVFVKCPLSVCEERDTKGLYKKARAGEVKEFTGISAPYEEPESPEIVVDTSTTPLDECVRGILAYLEEKGHLITKDGKSGRRRL